MLKTFTANEHKAFLYHEQNIAVFLLRRSDLDGATCEYTG